MKTEITFNDLSLWLKICAIAGFVGGLYVFCLIMLVIIAVVVL